MTSWKLAFALAAISLLLAFAVAAAQEPVRSFDQPNTRLKPGDTVRVTDLQGRAINGRMLDLVPTALTPDRGGAGRSSRLSVAPIVTPRAKRAAVSFVF